MAGSYKNRGPILNYSMLFLLALIVIVWAFFTILGWATIGRSQPQIAWYIAGGLMSLPIVALTLFSAMFILGEYSPSIYRDPALITFIMLLGSIVPLVFLIWWYWDLGVRCNEGTVKAIETPMCTKGGTGQVMIVWSNAAVSTAFAVLALAGLVLSFADLYFRRLKTVTQATVGAVKSITPKSLRGGGGGGTEEDFLATAGEDEPLPAAKNIKKSNNSDDLLNALGIHTSSVRITGKRRKQKQKRKFK